MPRSTADRSRVIISRRSPGGGRSSGSCPCSRARPPPPPSHWFRAFASALPLHWSASCQAVSCSTSAGCEFDRGGSRPRVHDAADDPFAVAAVLVAVGGVDLVVEVGVGVGEGDVLVDPAGPDMALLADLGGGEPAAAAPVHRTHIE